MFYCTLTRSKEHRKGQHSTVVKVKPPLATTATTVYGLDYADGWVPVDYSLAVDEEYEKREERRKIIGGNIVLPLVSTFLPELSLYPKNPK